MIHPRVSLAEAMAGDGRAVGDVREEGSGRKRRREKEEQLVAQTSTRRVQHSRNAAETLHGQRPAYMASIGDVWLVVLLLQTDRSTPP